MTKLFTTARKITAARIAGVGIGAGLVASLTKDIVSVAPVAGVALLGVAVLHRKMKEIDPDQDVSLGDLATVAGRAAGEVAIGSAAIHLAKKGVKAILAATGDADATVTFTDAPDVSTPEAQQPV